MPYSVFTHGKHKLAKRPKRHREPVIRMKWTNITISKMKSQLITGTQIWEVNSGDKKSTEQLSV